MFMTVIKVKVIYVYVIKVSVIYVYYCDKGYGYLCLLL